MTSRARLSRRPLQVGGLLLAGVALGTVTAPAASAMVDPTAPGDQTPEQAPEQAPAPAPVVLTNSPASYLGTPEQPVDFGTGKLQVSVAPEPGVDAPEEENLSGAVIEIAFPGDTDDGDATVTITCTTDAAGDCTYTDTTYADQGTGLLRVWPGQRFTITQVQPPSSGLFALPAGDDAVVHGIGTWSLPDLPLEVVPDDGATVDFAPSVTPAGDGMDRDGASGAVVLYDPLAQVSGDQPADPPVAPGAPAPDSTAPAVPVSAATATPAAATAAPTLATTGFDAVPAALVGGGLLTAGAGAVLVGRRRPRT